MRPRSGTFLAVVLLLSMFALGYWAGYDKGYDNGAQDLYEKVMEMLTETIERENAT